MTDIPYSVPFKVTLQHAPMSTESRFSEILLSGNLLIALQPIGLSKFCKKYGIAHTLCNRYHHVVLDYRVLNFFYRFQSHTALQTSFLFFALGLKQDIP